MEKVLARLGFGRNAVPRRALGAARAPKDAGAGLTVASYNVHKCVGTDRRFDPARVAHVIADLQADILALQEVDRRFGRRTGLLDMLALEQHTGLRLAPVSAVPGGHGWHGNALLVRSDWACRVQRFALPGGEPRGALVAEVSLPGGALRVVAAHFGLLRHHRTQQVGAILDILEAAPAMPTVVLGDLNEWRLGRRSSLRRLEAGFGVHGPGLATFPSRLPVLPLDRVFAQPHGLVRAVEAHDTPLARIASDHLPLRAELCPEALGAVLAAAA